MAFSRISLTVFDNPNGAFGTILTSAGLDNSAICGNFVSVTLKEEASYGEDRKKVQRGPG